jgi:hydroxylamine reductase (hybrid-cluster protein)
VKKVFPQSHTNQQHFIMENAIKELTNINWLEEKIDEQADIIKEQRQTIRAQKASIKEQAQTIDEQELEILALKAKVSELQDLLRAEDLRVKRQDFPDQSALRMMKPEELERLRKDTYDTWLWGSTTVDHEELAWRIGEIVSVMKC